MTIVVSSSTGGTTLPTTPTTCLFSSLNPVEKRTTVTVKSWSLIKAGGVVSRVQSKVGRSLRNLESVFRGTADRSGQTTGHHTAIMVSSSSASSSSTSSSPRGSSHSTASLRPTGRTMVKYISNNGTSQGVVKVMSKENELYTTSPDQPDVSRTSFSLTTLTSRSSAYLCHLHICDHCQSSIPWYFGSISREVVERVLEYEPVGSFIVRDSASKNGSFALSVRMPLELSRPHNVSHYLLVKSPRGRVQIKGFSLDFDCVSSLIEYHSRQREFLPCLLRRREDLDHQRPYHDQLRLKTIDLLTKSLQRPYLSETYLSPKDDVGGKDAIKVVQ